MRTWIAAIVLAVVFPAAAVAQSQITTSVARRRRHRRYRRRAARRHRRSAQPRHQLHPHRGDRRRGPVRAAAAAAGPLQGHLHARRVRHARAGEPRADRRSDGHALRAMKVSGVAETVTVSGRPPIVTPRGRPRRARSNQTAVESTPILGRKFEDLLTLTPGRQRRPGAGRRRDHVRRAARHLQQHQPRRRRLQQRLLRRAGRRPARRGRHHAGGGARSSR